ncbi:MAG: CHASE2 domain-containing protein [Acidobacteriia bacterium]|nr:CHASE2 domain-containing protein [Terriglobia bacterium]
MKLLPNPKNSSPITLGRWTRLNILLLGLVLFVSLSFPVTTLSQKLNDFYFRLRGKQPPSAHVALVLIDDETLARYGRWPWPRQLLARLIQATSDAQPKAIGVDILLSEPEDEQNDGALARAIASAPNLVLASKISSSQEGRLWVDPMPAFARAARGIGQVQAIIDLDGICRSLPLQEPSADGLRPAFSLQLARLADPGAAPESLTPDSGNSGIEHIRSVPRLTIDYRRQYDPGRSPVPFITISAADVLSGKDRNLLRGKTILMGFGSIEVSDRLMTPVSDQLPMPGVEINANAVDTLLTGRALAHIGLVAQLLLVVFVSSASLWLVVRHPGAGGLFLLAALLAAGYFGAFYLFLRFHMLLSYGPLLVAAVLAAPIAQLENLLIVDREVTSRLQFLRRAIQPRYGDTKTGEGGAIHPEAPPSERLHWKLSALGELQAELSSLYAFNQTLLETVRDGLAVFGADGTLRFSNSTWKKFCERQGRDLDTLAGIAEMTGGWHELATLPQEARAWSEHEAPLGEELWLFRAVRLPWTSFAESGALLLMAEDMTARRQRDQARSEALSFVTHELRTPLIAIQGFSELLMRYPNSPASNEAPGTIFRESNRLVAMINTYLEVLRLDSGARLLRLNRASLRDMAGHVEKVVRPLAVAAHMQVKVEIDSQEDGVMCDETLISGALLNLVSNAIKYGAHGTEVLLRVAAHENEVEFEVRNFGPIIPASELERLFDRFYRPSRSEAIPGWGLGLSFVRRICQQHGGRVQVSSSENSGTSFAFTLPRGAVEVTEVAP